MCSNASWYNRSKSRNVTGKVFYLSTKWLLLIYERFLRAKLRQPNEFSIANTADVVVFFGIVDIVSRLPDPRIPTNVPTVSFEAILIN